jgi:hypothetical protein
VNRSRQPFTLFHGGLSILPRRGKPFSWSDLATIPHPSVGLHPDRLRTSTHSAERLVERLLGTNNSDASRAKGVSLPPRADDDSDSTEVVIRLSLAAQLKRTGKEMKFVVEGDGTERSADPGLVRLIVRAHSLSRRLAENPGSSLEDVASQQSMGGPYAARLIRLNYLAPDIVAAILDGKQPVALAATKLMADTRLPLDWRAQRVALGFALTESTAALAFR